MGVGARLRRDFIAKITKIQSDLSGESLWYSWCKKLANFLFKMFSTSLQRSVIYCSPFCEVKSSTEDILQSWISKYWNGKACLVITGGPRKDSSAYPGVTKESLTYWELWNSAPGHQYGSTEQAYIFKHSLWARMSLTPPPSSLLQISSASTYSVWCFQIVKSNALVY